MDHLDNMSPLEGESVETYLLRIGDLKRDK